MSPRKGASAPILQLVSTEFAVPAVGEGPRLLRPEDAGREAARLIGGKDREHFIVFHLNATLRVISYETVAIGTLSEAPTHPREVFKAAILANSHGIICAHNHPSGDLQASTMDHSTYRLLQEAGELLGIKVLDFLIVADTRFLSLKQD